MTALTLIEDLASYVPDLIVRRLARDPSPNPTPSIERFPAAVLFADISGFTALTERLTRRGPAGAEELTQLLNAYFGQLIEIVTNHGGDVVKFAGDGLLALWPADDEALPIATFRAVQCALAVQMTMAPVAWSMLAEGREPPLPLRVRIGISAGDITTMILGGVFERWELLVTGPPLVQVSQAQQQARPGDVVIDGATWPLVADQCHGTPLPADGVAGAAVAMRLEALSDLLPLRHLPPLDITPELELALRAYIPKAILTRLVAGQPGWLAEMRRVTVLFINLPDLNETTPLELAQAALHAIQTALYRYEGSISRLGTDEKGPTLVAALGLPPLAHSDDATRGVQAALAVQAALSALGLRSAIGITSGEAFCGAVGSPQRSEYTMMGLIVNLAARLMQAALALPLDKGQATILCDAATYQATQPRLRFDPLPPMLFKGIADPIAVYRPHMGAQQAATAPVQAPPPNQLVGRVLERSLLTEYVQKLLRQGRSAVVLLEGDAGIGKSRLLNELREYANAQGLHVLNGSGNAIEQSTPYYAWRTIFSQLLDLDDSDDPAAHCSALLAELEPSGASSADLPLRRFAPLLNVVLPFDIPDNEISSQLSGQVRATNTRDLLLRLLRLLVSQQPQLLIIEDAQWLDSASWSLTLALSQALASAANIPLLFVIAVRTFEEAAPSEYSQLLRLPNLRHLRLEGLSAADTRTLLCQRLGVSQVPEPVWSLIYAQAQGNPFFSEELIYALRDSGLIVVNGEVCHLAPNAGDLSSLRLPDTVQGVIISRIDRLSAQQQLTLKVASVIGPEVPLSVLQALHPVAADHDEMANYLATLQLAGLIQLASSEPEPTYIFKHTIIRDVTYNLMSFDQRRRLHRALAEWYEQHYAADLEPHYALLAYHWSKAAVYPCAIAYLERAGELALRSGAYQEAIDFLSQALELDQEIMQGGNTERQTEQQTKLTPVQPGLPPGLRRATWERQLGEAYYGLGRLAESREHLEWAVALLGWPLPTTIQGMATSMFAQGLRQGLHRLLPARCIRWNKAAHPMLREAARAYDLLGQLYYYDNQLLASIHATLHSVNLAERAGPSPVLAQVYASMQIATSSYTWLPLSNSYARRATRTAQQVGQLANLVWILQATGVTHLGRGEWPEARTALERASKLAARLGDHRHWAESQSLLAWLTSYQGNFNNAERICANIYTRAQRYGDVQAQTWGLIGQVENMLPQGQNERAMTLLSEAEALLAENFDRARAEEIWAYALLALVALRCDQRPLARHSIATAAQLMGQVPPTAIYALAGYAGVAEVYLTLWEMRSYQSYAEQQELVQAARRACLALNSFGRAFPVVCPRARLWQGLYAWLGGQPQRAHKLWQQSLAAANMLAMPYEQGRAHYEIGRHATGATRRTHLTQAVAIFDRLGASYDLERTQMLLSNVQPIH